MVDAGECCGVLGGPHRAATQPLGNDIPIPSSWFRLRLDSCHRSPVARRPSTPPPGPATPNDMTPGTEPALRPLSSATDLTADTFDPDVRPPPAACACACACACAAPARPS
jgi:hypothetical protein